MCKDPLLETLRLIEMDWILWPKSTEKIQDKQENKVLSIVTLTLLCIACCDLNAVFVDRIKRKLKEQVCN